jgi:hypothetical protein
MITTRCCKNNIHVHHSQECSFYVCNFCVLACDKMIHNELDKEYGHDPRRKS